MARARLILDTRTKSKSVNEGLFPIAVRVFHKKPRMIRLSFSTSKAGWDAKNMMLKKYRSDRRPVNKLLKRIAADAGIEEKITSYYIRHSWATIAKNMGISTEIISEGLGHDSLKTTEICLKSFDNAVLDDANELIVA